MVINPVSGWLAINKPCGVTSTQVLNGLKRLQRGLKLGHAGTLDPLADGVLPVALGVATKLISYAQDGEKTYHFTIRWGGATTTDDAEGTVLHTSSVRPDEAAIRAALPQFIGTIMQLPPQFSALKVAGERAYDLARQGEVVALSPRPVQINTLTLERIIDSDSAVFSMTCGKGAYVRSIARDLGVALGTYGHITQLTRTMVGVFTLPASVTPASLTPENWLGHILPMDTVLADLPALTIDAMDGKKIRRGQALFNFAKAAINNTVYRVYDTTGFLALARLEQNLLKPLKVFASEEG